MPEITVCPHCGKRYHTAGLPEGKRLQCQGCEGELAVSANPGLVREHDTGPHEPIPIDEDFPEAQAWQDAGMHELRTETAKPPPHPEAGEADARPGPEAQLAASMSPKQAESMLLIAEAEETLQQAENYADYEQALQTFGKALELCKESEAAREGIIKAELLNAECALAKGDFDRAQRKFAYRTAAHRELSMRVYAAMREQRNRQLQRWSLIGGGVILVGLGIVAVLTPGPAPLSELPSRPEPSYRQPARRPRNPAIAEAKKLNDQALRHYRARKYQEAIKVSDKAIEKNPKSWLAYNLRGISRAALGNLDGAVNDYNQTIKLNPKWPGGYNNRGNVKMRQRDYVGAIEDFDQAIKLNPKSGMAYCNRARVSQVQGKLEAALSDYDKSIKKQPRYYDAYYLRGVIRRARGDLKGALADLSFFLRKKPKHAAAYAERGWAKTLQGDFNAAHKDYGKAIKRNPKLAVIYRYRGQTRANQDDFTGAIADYDQALKLNSKDIQAWMGRAVAAFAVDDKEAYLKAVEEAKKLTTNPQALESSVQRSARAARQQRRGKMLEGKEITKTEEYLARAQYRLRHKRFKEATADFEAALKLDPGLGAKGIFRLLMQTAEAQKNWQGKIKVLQRWVRAAPSANALNAYAWELLTSKDVKLQDPQAALPLARKAASFTEEKNSAILDTLGLALFRNGKVQEALETQKKAVALLPRNYPPAQRKEYEDRLKEFEAALAGQKNF